MAFFTGYRILPDSAYWIPDPDTGYLSHVKFTKKANKVFYFVGVLVKLFKVLFNYCYQPIVLISIFYNIIFYVSII
jgi:hypothetical protein